MVPQTMVVAPNRRVMLATRVIPAILRFSQRLITKEAAIIITP